MLDPIGIMAPLAIDAQSRGDAATVEAIRWIETHVPGGGESKLLYRLNSPSFFSAILYFLTFDPGSAAARRPAPGATAAHIWLEPDHIVVYDRADTTKPDRFKRFWLQLPARAAVNGNLSTVQTPRGQQLFVTTLLPLGAGISSPANQGTAGAPAEGVSMKFRLRVEAPGDPLQARFLHVVQGADGGAAANLANLLLSSSGTPYQGALVAGQAVLFPVSLGAFGGTTVPLPAGAARVLVTGLQPGGSYSATVSGGQLSVSSGGSRTADSGGVLTVTP